MHHTLRTMLITLLLVLPLANCGNAGENKQSAPSLQLQSAL